MREDRARLQGLGIDLNRILHFKLDHVREWLENRPRIETITYERENVNADRLLRELLPEELRRQIIEGTQKYEQGKLYKYLYTVGLEARKHPHVFFIRRTAQYTELLFVDPEHNIGKDHPIFPAANNLMAARIYPNEKNPEIAVIRYKTPQIVESLGSRVETISAQLQGALSLIDDKGLPKLLEGFEDQILFRLVMTQGEMNPSSHRPTANTILQAQSAYNHGGHFERFFRGDVTVGGDIQLKSRLFTRIMQRFNQFIQEEKFQKSVERKKE